MDLFWNVWMSGLLLHYMHWYNWCFSCFFHKCWCFFLLKFIDITLYILFYILCYWPKALIISEFKSTLYQLWIHWKIQKKKCMTDDTQWYIFKVAPYWGIFVDSKKNLKHRRMVNIHCFKKQIIAQHDYYKIPSFKTHKMYVKIWCASDVFWDNMLFI